MVAVAAVPVHSTGINVENVVALATAIATPICATLVGISRFVSGKLNAAHALLEIHGNRLQRLAYRLARVEEKLGLDKLRMGDFDEQESDVG